MFFRNKSICLYSFLISVSRMIINPKLIKQLTADFFRKLPGITDRLVF